MRLPTETHPACLPDPVLAQVRWVEKKTAATVRRRVYSASPSTRRGGEIESAMRAQAEKSLMALIMRRSLPALFLS